MKIVQWNARGLTKARLEEFKNFLSSSNPAVVILCETYWRSSFNVSFQSYNIFKKDRVDRQGGGVAILVHKSLQCSVLTVQSLINCEAIGVTVATSNYGQVDFISVYAPHGDFSLEEIGSFFL